MVNIPFNPFRKSLEEITAIDLLNLRDTSEGWYVEYKQEAVEPKKIAKSLAAFANSYGGWLFYGIKETSDGYNKADEFCRIPNSECETLITHIRNAASAAINPTPYFEIKQIDGPCTELGLSENKAIIIVLIPSGSDAPYVHAEGRIYRRVADSSEPKPENDRHILDSLFQRRLKATKALNLFLDDKPLVSESEGDSTIFNLYMVTDPLGVKGKFSKLKFDQFVDKLSNQNNDILSISFDNFFTMSDGFIARQVNKDFPTNLNITFNYFNNCSAILSANIGGNSNIHTFFQQEHLKNYKYLNDFCKLISGSKFNNANIVDVNKLYSLIVCSISLQMSLLEEDRTEKSLYCKSHFENIWRRIPFLDTKNHISHIEKHGIPIIQYNESTSPSGEGLDGLRYLSYDERTKGVDEIELKQFLVGSPCIGDIGTILGIPHDITLSRDVEWWEAALRCVTFKNKE